MSRISIPDMKDVSPSRQERMKYPAFMPLNVTRVALHLPDGLWEAHFDLKSALVKYVTLDEALREVLILRVGHLADCAYILNHHIAITTNLGFSAEKQEAIRSQDYGSLSEEERVVAEFTDAVVQKITPPAEVVENARKLFGERIVCELTVLVYSYLGTAMFAGVTGAPLDEHAIQSFDWTSEESR